MVVSDAAAILMAIQSAAGDGPDVDDGYAEVAMAVKIGSPIKLTPKALVFRCITQLQLNVGCRFMVYHSLHNTWGPSTCLIHVVVELILE